MSNTSKERTHRIKRNIIVTSLAKGVSILVSFLYVPLLLDSMDTANYAVWLTLTSLVSWLNVFDIGLGNGLRNRLSESLAKENILDSREYVTTGYISIFILVTFLAIMFLSISPHVDWNAIINKGQPPIVNLDVLVSVVCCSFFTNIAFSLINSILYALQLPGIISIISLIGQISSYITVLIMVKVFNITSLLSLGCVISLVPTILLFLATIILFETKANFIKPKLIYFRKERIRDILSLGARFFVLSIVTVVIFYSNNLIITQTLGAESVVIYNIAYKYMYISASLFTLVCIPIWSAATEAYVKGDFCWIKSIKTRLLQITLLFAILSVLQLLLSKVVFGIWIGKDCPNISYTTLGILLIYVVGMNMYASYGYIINGIGKLKIQMLCTSIIAVLYIPIAYFVSNSCGLNGLLCVVAIVPWLNFMWSSIQYNKLLNNKAKGLWNQ